MSGGKKSASMQGVKLRDEEIDKLAKWMRYNKKLTFKDKPRLTPFSGPIFGPEVDKTGVRHAGCHGVSRAVGLVP